MIDMYLRPILVKMVERIHIFFCQNENNLGSFVNAYLWQIIGPRVLQLSKYVLIQLLRNLSWLYFVSLRIRVDFNALSFYSFQNVLCWHKKQFYWLQIIFLSGTKCLRLPQYVNKFLVWHKKFGPAQNILGPVKGQGIRWFAVLINF